MYFCWQYILFINQHSEAMKRLWIVLVVAGFFFIGACKPRAERAAEPQAVEEVEAVEEEVVEEVPAEVEEGEEVEEVPVEPPAQ